MNISDQSQLQNKLPSGWRYDRLKDIVTLRNEKTESASEIEDYLELEDIEQGTGRILNRRNTLEVVSAVTLFKRGDVLFGKLRPYLEKYYEAEFDGKCTGEILAFKPAGVDSTFLRYCVGSPWFIERCNMLAYGAKMPRVNWPTQLAQFNIPLPPPNEQKRIAGYLNASCAAIDAAVDAKRKQIETLAATEDSIIYGVVTKGLNQSAAMGPTGLDWNEQAPVHWHVRQIKRMCVLVRGQFTHRPRNDPALYDGPYPFIQTGDITAARKYIRSYSQTLNEVGLSVSKMFPKGTLVMSIAANIGDVAILDFEACFPDSMIGMIPNAGTDLHYLYYLMRAIKPIMLRSAVLSTQLNLNYVRIGVNFAAFPPLDEQRAIAKHLEAKEDEIASIRNKLQRQIDTLTTYRKSLIHECVTGQRRVTEAELARVTAHA